MKNNAVVLLFLLSLITLSACSNKNETTVSTTTKIEKDYSSKTTEAHQSRRDQSSSNSTLSSQTIGNEETQKSGESENTTIQQPPVSNPSEVEKNAKADIYNRLVSARDAAVEHQKQTIARGGTANDVQSPLSALIFESNILETEYPQYIDYIRTTIKELGY